MAYDDKIYDITALEIFKRLEYFLNKKSKRGTFQDKVKNFANDYPGDENAQKAKGIMTKLAKIRNKIVHPDRDSDITKSLETVAVLKTLSSFEAFRDKCIELEKKLRQIPNAEPTGINEIMIPTLKYDMGNLGDIIKHGLLAEFVEWWLKHHNERKLVYVDTFGGCPWGGNPEVLRRFNRLDNLKGTALFRANNKKRPEKYQKYLGSVHLVKAICPDATLFVCDRNNNARSNLRASGLQVGKLPEGNEGLKNDGFKILIDEIRQNRAPGTNLILLDPYGDFIREECREEKYPIFKKIIEQVNNHDIWVVLFVMDLFPEIKKIKSRKSVIETHESYEKFRDDNLKDKAVYLHCPQARKSKIKSDKKYDTEVLLISKQLENKDCPKIKALLKRLENFATKATKAFGHEEKESAGLFELSGDKKIKFTKL